MKIQLVYLHLASTNPEGCLALSHWTHPAPSALPASSAPNSLVFELDLSKDMLQVNSYARVLWQRYPYLKKTFVLGYRNAGQRTSGQVAWLRGVQMAQTIERVVDTEPGTIRSRILLADENADMRRYLKQLLGAHYEVDSAADPGTALTLARKRTPDLVVADVMMRTMGDFDLVSEFRRDAWGKVPIILYSAPCDEDSCVNAIEAGANEYLITPFSERQLLALIRAQLRVARIRHD